MLKIENLTAGYSGNVVLENINLCINDGDFTGIIGPNGGGKTTLFRIILGIIAPISGTISFSRGFDPLKDLGYMPQMPEGDKAFPVTVEDVVISGLMPGRGLMARFGRNDRTKADSVMEELGILNLRKTVLSELSGGQVQRVYLGRAIIGSPKILLLDEPGNFVDANFEHGFYDRLNELNRRMAILMVSHDVGMISSYVRSFACINRNLHYHDSGKITSEQLQAYGCPIQLVTHGEVPHIVLKKHS